MTDDLSNLIKELDEVATALDANGIEYAVCGGLALTIHGFPRATFDLDVLIRAENLEKAFQAVHRSATIFTVPTSRSRSGP